MFNFFRKKNNNGQQRNEKESSEKQAAKCFQCLRPIDGHIRKLDNKEYCNECYNRKMAIVQQTEGQPPNLRHPKEIKNVFTCTKCRRTLSTKYLHDGSICSDCFVPPERAKQIVPAPQRKQKQSHPTNDAISSIEKKNGLEHVYCQNNQHHFTNLEHFATGSKCLCKKCGLVVRFNRGHSERIDPDEAATFLKTYAGSAFDFYYPPMFHNQNHLSEQAEHSQKTGLPFLAEEYKLNLPKTLFRWSDHSSDLPGDYISHHWEDVVLCEDGRLIMEGHSMTYDVYNIAHNFGKSRSTKPLSFGQLPKMIALAKDKEAEKYAGMNEQNWPKYVRVRKTNKELASELETIVTIDLDYCNQVDLCRHKTTGRLYIMKSENEQHGFASIFSIISIERAFLSDASSMVAKEYDYARAYKLLHPKWEEYLCQKVLAISDGRYRMAWFVIVDGVEIPQEEIYFGEAVFQVPAKYITQEQFEKYAPYHTQTGPFEHYYDLPAECCEKVVRKLIPIRVMPSSSIEQ